MTENLKKLKKLIIAGFLLCAMILPGISHAEQYMDIAHGGHIYVYAKDGTSYDYAESVFFDAEKKEWVLNVHNLKGDTLQYSVPASKFWVQRWNTVWTFRNGNVHRED